MDKNDQIPAKIWELLRRNRNFRDLVLRLSKLDSKERNDWKKTGQYHGAAWQKSCRLLKRVSAQHPFAGVALQWLVPEPLFRCDVATRPRGSKWKKRKVFATRFLREGEGLTPDIKSKSWVWQNPEKVSFAGSRITRGPELHWTNSRFKRLRDLVNPILEWRRYPWPFTVEHTWNDAPAQFCREFHSIWRRHFDCRPLNPLTKTRRDSPAPYETSFFHDWDLMSVCSSGQLTQADLYQTIRFKALADNFRVFAIPKTILTKASAEAQGQWLAEELKKGSHLYGDLLKGKLLNDGEMFGTTNEWADWLLHHSGVTGTVAKDTHYYRRCRYMTSLVDLIFPGFDIGKLLAPPPHRARGKKYVRK